MNSNRRWVAMAFLAFGILLWILTTKFMATLMGWIGIEQYDFHLVGERFTLTTFLGLLIGGFATFYGYRHPTLSTLMNEVVVELKKVTWPTGKETRSATVVVLITVFIMAVFLGIFDLFWSKFMDDLYPSSQAG
jgi:preprotein translocase subunit SecE